jgi:hypothetical protein
VARGVGQAAAVSVTREAMDAPCEQTPVTWERPDQPMPPIRPGRYLDPAILRGPATLAPAPAPILVRLHVREPELCDYQLGQRVELGSSSVDPLLRTLTVSVRWAKVVSWDRASGELVVQPDER